MALEKLGTKYNDDKVIEIKNLLFKWLDMVT